MRRAVIVLGLIAACGSAAAPGPAWPRSAGTVTPTDAEDDGGESLEPRSTEHPAAALEAKGDDAVAVAPADPFPIALPPGTTVTPATLVPPPSGEVIEIQLEDITITPADPPPVTP